MQRLRWIFAVLAFPLAASAAEVPSPAGWRQQKRAFPLDFAPSIGLQGEEHVRFAPAFARFDSEDGFSYVFLWDVKDVKGPALTVTGLEFALASYFDGLMGGVASARQLASLGPRSHVVLHPMRDVPGWTEAHAGDVYTWNAFGASEPLQLHLEITKRACGMERVQVFFALSKASRTHAAWESLRAIRQGTTC